MTLTLEITPSEEARLATAALQWGMEPAEFIKRLIALHPSENGRKAVGTPEEHIQAIDSFVEKKQGLPVLSDNAFGRANLYDDRR